MDVNDKRCNRDVVYLEDDMKLAGLQELRRTRMSFAAYLNKHVRAWPESAHCQRHLK